MTRSKIKLVKTAGDHAQTFPSLPFAERPFAFGVSDDMDQPVPPPQNRLSLLSNGGDTNATERRLAYRTPPVPHAVERPSRSSGESAEFVLSKLLLPTSGTMVGICATIIGLAKVVEKHAGPTHVDELSFLVLLVFLASAACSYLSIRHSRFHAIARRLEAVADVLFLVGLVSLAAVGLFFACELI